jgi:hypothetical protein
MTMAIKFSGTTARLVNNNVYRIMIEGINSTDEVVKTYTNNQLVLVLDRSGSMGGSPIEDSKIAMKNIVDQTPRDVKITLVTFDNNAQAYNPKNHDEAKRLITSFHTGGSTSFSAAIDTITANIDTSKTDINIVFLTDGQDNASGGSYYSYGGSGKTTIESSISKLKTKITGKNTKVYSLGFSSGHDAKFLGELTNIGSEMGLFQYVRNSSEITKSIVPILGLMSEEKIEFEINSTKISMTRDDEGIITGRLITQMDFAKTVKYKFEYDKKFYTGSIAFEDVELPLNETVNIIGDQIRESIKNGILTLKTNPDSMKRAISEVKESESYLEKIRKDAQRLPRLIRKNVINSINDIYPMTAEFYRLTSVGNARSMGNDTIAKLNEIAYSGQLKRGNQKRLDKRAEVNVEKFKDFEKDALKIVDENSDFSVPDDFKDVTDFLSQMGVVDSFKDGDCMCITLRVARKENAVNDPSKLKIIEIYSSFMSAGSFQDAVSMVNPGSMGDFNAASSAFVIKGEGNNEISAVFPLYINDTHWKMAKVHMRQILGLITTLDPLGYQRKQIDTVPFIILNKAKRNLYDNPSEFNQRMYKMIFDTCKAIMIDFKMVDGIIKMYDDFFEMKNRTIDVVADINVFATQVMTLIQMDVIKKDARFNDFIKYMIEEQHRRLLPRVIVKDEINRLVNTIFKIPYDDYYKNEIINMENMFESTKKSAGSGEDIRYMKSLYKQHKKIFKVDEAAMIKASGGGDFEKLSVKSISTYKIPDEIDFDNMDKFPSFKSIFDIDDPTFTKMEKIMMMIQNRYHTKNDVRTTAITEKTCYTLDTWKNYFENLIKTLIKDRKDSEITRVKNRHTAMMSSSGAVFFGNTDNLDAAAGYLAKIRTFGSYEGHSIIEYMIQNHCVNILEKIKMLRTGVYYKEYTDEEGKTEKKRFILQYFYSTKDGKKKGNIIRWNPTKSTCNRIYNKYYDRDQSVKDRKKLWKKVFRGCKDFGGVVGKEHTL